MSNSLQHSLVSARAKWPRVMWRSVFIVALIGHAACDDGGDAPATPDAAVDGSSTELPDASAATPEDAPVEPPTDAPVATPDADAVDGPTEDTSPRDALVGQPLPNVWQPHHVTTADGGVDGSDPAAATLLHNKILLRGQTASNFGVGKKMDELDFLYQNVPGDAEVSARVTTAGYCGHSDVRMGVMMRASLDGRSPFAFAGVTAGSLFGSLYRERAGEPTRPLVANSFAFSTTDVRLVRRGSTVEAGFSLDGEQWHWWNKVLTAPAFPWAGLAMASSAHTPDCIAIFDRPRVRRFPPPRPWLVDEVATEEVGSAEFIDGRFLIKGAGENIEGSNDRFMFVHHPAVGDVQITARLVEWNASATAARAGLMIRTSLNKNSVMGAVTVNDSLRLASSVRSGVADSIGETTVADVRTLPLWLRLERRGDTVSFYNSQDGSDWRLMRSGTLRAASDRAFVGLMVVDDTQPANATFDSVSVGLPTSAMAPP